MRKYILEGGSASLGVDFEGVDLVHFQFALLLLLDDCVWRGDLSTCCSGWPSPPLWLLFWDCKPKQTKVAFGHGLSSQHQKWSYYTRNIKLTNTLRRCQHSTTFGTKYHIKSKMSFYPVDILRPILEERVQFSVLLTGFWTKWKMSATAIERASCIAWSWNSLAPAEWICLVWALQASFIKSMILYPVACDLTEVILQSSFYSSLSKVEPVEGQVTPRSSRRRSCWHFHPSSC